MDPMKRVAAGAVRKNLGPDPSMGRKVELLRRLVSMRKGGSGGKPRFRPPGGPMAGINRPSRSRKPLGPRSSFKGSGRPVWEGVPKRGGSRPMAFTRDPDYNFGPPE